jgi:UDP-glucose:(heptosyl)LPS alpha-1,3-glucosyltransferase
MNIAIIRRKFNPFGGAEKFISRAIKSLSKDKIKVSIISENWNDPTKPAAEDFEFIQAKTHGFARKTKFINFQKSVQKILGSRKFDLIQSHERLIGTDIYRLGDGVHAAWIHRQSTIAPWYRKIWLKLDPYHRAVIKTEKAMTEDPNLTFVANSSMVKEELIKWYGVPDSRIVLIENGIDTQSFNAPSTERKYQAKSNLGLHNQQPTVVFIGSGYSRKGAFELIYAMQELKNWQLIIVGADKRINHLKKIIRKQKLEKRIIVAGPQEDIRPYLDAGDIFCLPSLYDSFPNAILEALCCGLPVVTTEAVGIAEAIKANNAGDVCQRNPVAIKNALERVWSNKEIMSKNAISLSKKYDIKLTTELWLNLYHQLIKKKKAIYFENITY